MSSSENCPINLFIMPNTLQTKNFVLQMHSELFKLSLNEFDIFVGIQQSRIDIKNPMPTRFVAGGGLTKCVDGRGKEGGGGGREGGRESVSQSVSHVPFTSCQM